MKNKLISILLVGTMCSMILMSAGCDKQKQKSTSKKGDEIQREEYITDDAPWYEFEEVELESVGNDIMSYHYVNDELLSLIYDQSRKTYSVVRYDEEGKKKSTYDLNLGNYNDIHNSEELPNGLAICGNSQEKTKGPDSKWLKISFDGDNMELAPMEDNGSYENANAIDVSKIKELEAESKNGFYIGDYYICQYHSYNSGAGTMEEFICYVDKKDNVTTLSATDLFALNSEKRKSIEYMLPLSANEVFLKIKDSMNKENEFYSLNLDTKEKKELKLSDEQEEVVELVDSAGRYIKDGTIHTIDRDEVEIQKIDLAAGTKETILDLRQSFFDNKQSHRLQTLSIKDGVVKLIQHGDEGENDKIYTFRKADKNPNVGKKVLNIAPLFKKLNESVDVVDTVVRKFNKSSSEYYAIQIDDYCEQSRFSNISDKLLIDLMNANGPDIILNGFEFDQLNNEDYFVDLSSFAEEFDTDDYFYNIIDIAKQDGKLFQLPVEFELKGLLIPTMLVGDDKWIDFDTYNEICEEKSKGYDAIMNYAYRWLERSEMGKDEKKNLADKLYITNIISNMKEPIVKNGEINIDTDEFKKTMDFLKKRLSADLVDEREGKIVISVIKDNAYRCCLEQIEKRKNTFCGLPSSTKQSPAADIISSAAITTTCKDKEGAYDFLRILMEGNTSINKKNSIEELRKGLERWNGFVVNDKEGKFTDQNYVKDIDDEINKHVANVENITTVLRVDTTILDIICNEMQPYFTDSKSYEDTLEIVKDCCEKALKER